MSKPYLHELTKEKYQDFIQYPLAEKEIQVLIEQAIAGEGTWEAVADYLGRWSLMLDTLEVTNE